MCRCGSLYDQPARSLLACLPCRALYNVPWTQSSWTRWRPCPHGGTRRTQQSILRSACAASKQCNRIFSSCVPSSVRISSACRATVGLQVRKHSCAALCVRHALGKMCNNHAPSPFDGTSCLLWCPHSMLRHAYAWRAHARGSARCFAAVLLNATGSLYRDCFSLNERFASMSSDGAAGVASTHRDPILSNVLKTGVHLANVAG